MLGALSSSARAVPENDWPMTRHDARNTAHSEQTIHLPLKLEWRVPYCKHPSAVMLASGGAVCVSNELTYVGEPLFTALYSISGKLLWQIPDVIPVYLKDDKLVVLTQKFKAASSSFICYNWKQKRKVWERPVGGYVWQFWGAIETGGRLYCSFSYATTGDFRYACLNEINISNGSEIAKRRGGVQEWSVGPPVSDGEHIYYGVGHQLLILNSRTLDQEFEYEDGGNANLIFTGSNLITKGWDHTMRDFDAVTMGLLWSHGAGREILHCLAAGPRHSTLLVESSTAEALPSGKLAWSAQIYAVDSVSSRDLVFAASSDTAQIGGFAAVDSATGKLRWKYERNGMSGVSIIVSEGCVYGTGSDGCLYKFSSSP
jgi:outer membrane protein assembly factor BamB